MNSIYTTPRTLPQHQNQAVSCHEEDSLMNANVSLHGYTRSSSIKSKGSSSGSNKKSSSQKIKGKKSSSTSSTTSSKKTRPKKQVRFLSEEAQQEEPIWEYEAAPLDVFYTEEDYEAMIQDMRTALELYEANPWFELEEDPVDADITTTMRGLERRTPSGQAERLQWRTDHRNAVLDEQDRQWAILDDDEPTDDWLLSMASLTHSRDAAVLARTMGQDYAREEQVAGEDNGGQPLELVEEETPLVFSCRPSCDSPSEDSVNDDEESEEDATVAMDGSFNTLRSFYSSTSSVTSASNGSNSNSHCPFQSSRQSFLCSSLVLEEVDEDNSNRTDDDDDDDFNITIVRTRPEGAPNAKGHTVSFPLSLQDLYQNIPASQNALCFEDVKRQLWNPGLRLDDIPHKYKKELSFLEGTGEGVKVDEHSLRGLEAYTIAALADVREARATLLFAIQQKQQDSQNSDETLARTSQKLTSKARRMARSRGILDHRSIKSYYLLDTKEDQKVTKHSSSKKLKTSSSKGKSSNSMSRSSHSTSSSKSRKSSSSSKSSATSLPPSLAWTSQTPVTRTTSPERSSLPPKLPVRSKSRKSTTSTTTTSTKTASTTIRRSRTTGLACPIDR